MQNSSMQKLDDKYLVARYLAYLARLGLRYKSVLSSHNPNNALHKEYVCPQSRNYSATKCVVSSINLLKHAMRVLFASDTVSRDYAYIVYCWLDCTIIIQWRDGPHRSPETAECDAQESLLAPFSSAKFAYGSTRMSSQIRQ